jgi:hypothetical protein
MGEHMFDRERSQTGEERSRGDHAGVANREREPDAICHAIELAEQALEEASRARQDWSAVGRVAAELACLAESLAGAPTDGQTGAAK